MNPLFLPTRTFAVALAFGFGTLVLLGLASCRVEKSEAPAGPAPAEAPRGPDFFAEKSDLSTALKKFACRNGEDKEHHAILETLGGGVGVIDYDGDGLYDLVFPGGGDFAGSDNKTIIGYPTRVFRNKGQFEFEDVTEEVLPAAAQAMFYSHGVAVCDYDGDGWPDLLITGYGRVALYRNVDAGGNKRKFVDVTEEAGLLRPGHFWATGAAFGDLDGDGCPDLYLCQYVDWSWDHHPRCLFNGKPDVCSPENFNAKQHALYRNIGGKFIEVTKEAGLRVEADDPGPVPGKGRAYCGNGLGVLMADIDGDGKPDIYVANDATGNFLYLNRSTPGHVKLEEAGQDLGVSHDLNLTPTGSMGVDAADIDGGGEPALLVTNFVEQMHALYRLTGDKSKSFYHASVASGLGAIGKSYVGWGVGFLDLDNDGWMDAAISSGHVLGRPVKGDVAQRPVLFANKGEGKGQFRVATEQGGPYFRKAHRGRGLAVADLDNDGRPDLVISHVNARPAVLQNVYPAKNHWLGVRLLAPDHADVTGARAVLAIGGRKLTQLQKSGGSYLSARDPRLLFGLGPDTQAGTLTVYWPRGEPRVERWSGLETGKYHTLVQGEGEKA